MPVVLVLVALLAGVVALVILRRWKRQVPCRVVSVLSAASLMAAALGSPGRWPRTSGAARRVLNLATGCHLFPRGNA